MNEAIWTNGKKTITGWWCYNWSGDYFKIWLNQRDRTTGQKKEIISHNDTPEWGKWKLLSCKDSGEKMK